MKILSVILLMYCFGTLFCTAEQTGTGGVVLPTCELYSWENTKGDWNFALMYTTDRQKMIAEVLEKKSAMRLDRLKQEISKLAVHSNIVWFDCLTLGGVRLKGSEALKYPSKEMVKEIKHYAAERNIEVSGPEHRIRKAVAVPLIPSRPS